MPQQPYEPSHQGPDVTDPESGLMRMCATPCYSCILHQNPDKRLLEPRSLTSYLDRIAARNEFVICHNTVSDLGLSDGAPPAICAGYMDEDGPADEQEWRRSWRARMIKSYGRTFLVPPPAPSLEPTSPHTVDDG